VSSCKVGGTFVHKTQEGFRVANFLPLATE
jgi:hypothetical protein